MAIAADLWFEKSNLALQEAKMLIDTGSLPGAASRAYYGLYSYLTGLLIGAGIEPPAAHGNWSHDRMPTLIREHCKASFEKRTAMELIGRLYQMRLKADYGDHRGLDPEELDVCLRRLGAVLTSQWRV